MGTYILCSLCLVIRRMRQKWTLEYQFLLCNSSRHKTAPLTWIFDVHNRTWTCKKFESAAQHTKRPKLRRELRLTARGRSPPVLRDCLLIRVWAQHKLVSLITYPGFVIIICNIPAGTSTFVLNVIPRLMYNEPSNKEHMKRWP